MHINTFDRFEHRYSLIHDLDPRVKVVVTLLFIIANVLLPDGAWWAFLAGWLFLLWLTRLADLPLTYAVKRAFIVLPFTLAAVTVMFTLPGRTLASWHVGTWDLVVTDAGILRFASIVIRSWLSIQCAILLTATTALPDLLHALEHLRLPRVLIAIIAFMYRYLFVLADEALRLLRARESRSARGGAGKAGGTIAWRARVAGHMVGQLFMRSLERSDRVYNAMLARGYDGRLLTLNPHEMRRQDWAAGVLAVFLIAGIQLLGHLLT
ncbi:MAG: cobalt ECF transporter T component CbiQ [Anaerolineales bacterium]|nr:cobalt ECF transporter T component CbiQ [Anaerolineales bacterium]MCB8951293.1 cobalt ECF transporter T component CbiQ [Ardenticatenales bacterium]